MNLRKNILSLFAARLLIVLAVGVILAVPPARAQGGRRTTAPSSGPRQASGHPSRGAFEKWRGLARERDEVSSDQDEAFDDGDLRRRQRKSGSESPPGGLDPKRKRRIGRSYRRYQTLSEAQRSQLKRTWQRFRGLPPERRESIIRRMKKWEKLSPQQQDMLRQRRRRFLAMTPQQRQDVVEKGKQWFRLSPQQRQARRESLAQTSSAKEDPPPSAAPRP